MSQERARHDSEASEANQCFVKLRNLSKTTTEDDIREFLHRKFTDRSDIDSRSDLF